MAHGDCSALINFKKLKNYSVVHFSVDNSIEVVPSSWILPEQDKCHFPIVQPKGFKRIQENWESSPDPSWQIWEVAIKKTYGEFESFIAVMEVLNN